MDADRLTPLMWGRVEHLRYLLFYGYRPFTPLVRHYWPPMKETFQACGAVSCDRRDTLQCTADIFVLLVLVKQKRS